MWTSCAWNSAGGVNVLGAPSLRSPRRPARGARQPARPAPGAPRGAALSARFLAASSAQLDESFSDLIDFLSPGLAIGRRGRARRARLLVDRALDRFLGRLGRLGRSSGFLATSTFFGADIMLRIAAASSSAALRRFARSAARCFSSFSTVPALTTRNAGLAGSAGAASGAAGLLRGGRGCSGARRPPWPPWRSPWARSRPRRRPLPLPGLRPRGRAPAAASSASRSARSCSSRWRRCAASSSSWARSRSASACASSSRRRSSSSRASARDGVLGRRRDLVALDEGALLAHLDLDRARLAARVGLLDLARRLARQRDLLALAARGGAVRGAQVVEQARLVALGDRVAGRRLADAGRLQLLEQRRGRAIELGGELGDGCRCHRCLYPCVVVSCAALARSRPTLAAASAAAWAAFSCAAASAANQCSRAFMIIVLGGFGVDRR